MKKAISGFSKKSKAEKIDWLSENYLQNDPGAVEVLKSYWHPDANTQQLHDDFIENSLTNYYLPFGLAPNFLINGKVYAVPMVIEESSVVAAASNAAKFWMDRGGFRTEVLSSVKNGQIHLNFEGPSEKIENFFKKIKPTLQESIRDIEKNMKARGGGLLDLTFVKKSDLLPHYFYIHASFETLDAMGANFINSCLEKIADVFDKEAKLYDDFIEIDTFPEVVMSILSNYVPDCLVRAEVSCPVEALSTKTMNGEDFAGKFVRAVNIAEVEVSRAVTHNKGIMNGIDAVVLATGNDFRAVEAGVHAYASRDGVYRSLTHAEIENDIFRFWIEVPLAIGTVGGLTSLHPMTGVALEILQKPNAKELMEIMAATGLAQNFAAVRSLITTGIQEGHMKMHLMNILNQCGASKKEKKLATAYFKTKVISHSAVESYLKSIRE